MIQELIQTKITGENKDRTVHHWHASRLGSCECGIYLERMGEERDEEFDARTLRVFRVGNVFEDWVVQAIRDSGAKVETQVELEDKALDLIGHMDARIDGVAHEFKTIHSRAFWHMAREGGPYEHHKMQLWAYLHMLKEKQGKLVYISKDDLAINEYIVSHEDDIGSDVLKSLERLNIALERKVAPMAVLDPSDWRFRRCNWHSKCLEVALERKDITKEELAENIKKLKASERNQINDKIKALCLDEKEDSSQAALNL